MRKYRNQPTVIAGIRFDSKKEALRYVYLRQLEKEGKISNLQLQPRFPIVINGIKICEYRADFSYMQDGVRIIEDVKGVRTQVFIIKSRLMRAVHGIEVLET